MHCNQCPFLHQVSSARRSFAFISGSASLSNSKRAVIEIKGALLLGQPVHQELCYRHGRRPSTATPIRASFCRRTGACRSLSQPLFRISWNQGVTHWTLQAKSCAKGVLLLAYRLGQVLQNALHFEVATGDPHPFGNPLLGQPVHQELCYRHGRRPSTATPIRASFCRRTGACRSLSQPLFRISWNQGVTHWTLQAKSCAKGVLLLAYRLGQVLQNALHFEVATGDPHPFGNPSK